MIKKIESFMTSLKVTEVKSINTFLFYVLIVLTVVNLIPAIFSINLWGLFLNISILGGLYYVNPIKLNEMDKSSTKSDIHYFGIFVSLLFIISLGFTFVGNLFEFNLIKSILLLVPIYVFYMYLIVLFETKDN